MAGLCAPPSPHDKQSCDACWSSDVLGKALAWFCKELEELDLMRSRAIAIRSGEKWANRLWTMSFAAAVVEAAR
jgi:hypothetical protein